MNRAVHSSARIPAGLLITPDSFISVQRSLPSRCVRPLPQKPNNLHALWRCCGSAPGSEPSFHARASEQTDFTTLGERTDQVNYFQTRFKDLGRTGLVGKRRSRAVISHLSASIGPSASIGSPRTLIRRPRAFSPTGTVIVFRWKCLPGRA